MRNWNIQDPRIKACRGRSEPFVLGSGQSNTSAPNSRPALCRDLVNPTRGLRIRGRHFVGIWTTRHEGPEFATDTLSGSGQSDTKAPNSRPALCRDLVNPTRCLRIRDRHFAGIKATLHEAPNSRPSSFWASGQSDTMASNSRLALCRDLGKPSRRLRMHDRHFVGICAIRRDGSEFADDIFWDLGNPTRGTRSSDRHFVRV